jgi:hypothetical protein
MTMTSKITCPSRFAQIASAQDGRLSQERGLPARIEGGQDARAPSPELRSALLATSGLVARILIEQVRHLIIDSEI